MRILLINNFFRPVGGVERVFFAERALLQQHGHDVIDFSTLHTENFASPYEKYFVSGVDFQKSGNIFKKIGRLIHSREVAKKLSALIAETRPDVAHIHGMFDLLGPTVAHTLRAARVPMVFTAHAYKLVCPNGRLFSRDAIDESCRRNLFNDVLHASVQNSFVKSFAGAFALWLNQRRGTFHLFDRIVSPSMFLIQKHVEFGFDAAHFLQVPNPIEVTKFELHDGEGRYVLCVARLVPEKGIRVLLDAAHRLPHIPIKIIGDGPERDALQQYAVQLNLKNVIFEGAQSAAEVSTYLRDAAAVVVPSVCYETDPYSVLEAQACGRVVVAAYTGGISEQIRDGETGFLVERGNAEALATTLERVWQMSPSERAAIGRRARGFVDTVRNPELYYEGLMDLFGGLKNGSN